MPDPSVLETDILTQPAAYRVLTESGPGRWAPALAALAALPGEQTVLAAMGASYAAACGAAAAWSSWAVPARAELASDLLYHPGRLGPRDRVLLLSQSGSSAELVRLADQLAAIGTPFVSMTNGPGTPLGSRARAQIILDLPPDHGVAIKTFGGMLLALLYLGQRLAGRALADSISPALETAEALAGAMAEAAGWRALGAGLAGRPGCVVLARGGIAAAAREAALLANEVAKVPAWYEESGQFRHGIIEYLEPGHVAAVLVPGDPGAQLQVSLIRELAATGAAVLATAAPEWARPAEAAGARVLPVPAVSAAYAPVLHVLPFQWLTLGWAEARGLVPGQFRHVPAVITREGSVAE